MSKDPLKTSGGDGKTGKDESQSSSGSGSASSATNSGAQRPKLVGMLDAVDNTLGLLEHAFLAVALASLIGVGTYQFVASHFFDLHSTWPFEALRYLVFFTAMGGAALSAQKGRMISMDFLARKLAPRNRVKLRMAIACFVFYASYLLVIGGVYVRNVAAAEEYEYIDPGLALLVLPVGAGLIGIHYVIHAFVDGLYLAAGMVPPEEDGPQAH